MCGAYRSCGLPFFSLRERRHAHDRTDQRMNMATHTAHTAQGGDRERVVGRCGGRFAVPASVSHFDVVSVTYVVWCPDLPSLLVACRVTDGTRSTHHSLQGSAPSLVPSAIGHTSPLTTHSLTRIISCLLLTHLTCIDHCMGYRIHAAGLLTCCLRVRPCVSVFVCRSVCHPHVHA